MHIKGEKFANFMTNTEPCFRPAGVAISVQRYKIDLLRGINQ